MVSEEKIKLMTKIAVYESGEGEKDLNIAHFHLHQYINIQTIRAMIINTLAFGMIVFFISLLFMDTILQMIERHGYRRYVLLVLLLYIAFMVIQILYTRAEAKEHYEEALPRIRLYKKDLTKLFYMYELKENPEEVKPEELEETLEEEMNAESVEF